MSSNTENLSTTSFTSTVRMSTPLPKSLTTCPHSTMSTAWGSAYCWPLVGTSASSAKAVDEAEKTDEENKMEKWICEEVLGENLSPLNLLDRCLITFSHYQSLTSKATTISTSSVDHLAQEPRSPIPEVELPPLVLLPSSRSLFRPFCPGGPSQNSAVSSRLGASRMGMRRNWRSAYRARG